MVFRAAESGERVEEKAVPKKGGNRLFIYQHKIKTNAIFKEIVKYRRISIKQHLKLK